MIFFKKFFLLFNFLYFTQQNIPYDFFCDNHKIKCKMFNDLKGIISLENIVGRGKFQQKALSTF